jgi:hypothetical protein
MKAMNQFNLVFKNLFCSPVFRNCCATYKGIDMTCKYLLALFLVITNFPPLTNAQTSIAPAPGADGAAQVLRCNLPQLPTPALLSKPQGTSGLIPAPPAYPFGNRKELIADAQCLSDALDRYITAWLDGRVPAEIPPEFLPPGINLKDFPRWRLAKPGELTPEQQWAVRPARPINTRQAAGFFPDPNVTYIVLPAMLLPFGHRVVVEGEFPHARFFNLQVTPSFDPASYHYDGGTGVGEVPIVDADIEALPGHVNPYRVGAQRDAVQRSYRITFNMAVGDPVALNPAFRPPYFRDSSNKSNQRTGSGILFQGPWGSKGIGGHGRGNWDAGQLWMRLYRPDTAKGPLGGVSLPHLRFETPDGRAYFVTPDIEPFSKRANALVPVAATPPAEPTTDPKRRYGPEHGWFKQAGIFRAVVGGLALNTGMAGAEYVRLLDKGVTGRGYELKPPNSYEQSATSATYIDYLVRGMALGKDKVVVLTGKLPTFPATRAGQSVMRGAEMRYWSLTGYEVPDGWSLLSTLLGSQRPIGVAAHAVMDEDIVLDKERRYVIVLSRAQDKPANATAANGVTWVDWGPSSEISWTLRWLTVGPEWTAPSAPTPQKLRTKTDLASADFDPKVISQNNHSGALGEYLPRLHYLSSKEFEALGSNTKANQIPHWR